MANFPLLIQSALGTSYLGDISLDSADWIALASFVVSALALWVSIHFAKRAERMSKLANDIAIGQAETNLRTAIGSGRQALQQCNIQIVTIRKDKKPDELTSEERSVYYVYLATYDTAAEQLLNSYEDACAKYLDGKIDTTRFKQTYEAEIRDLCEKARGTIHKLLNPRESSKYKNIWSAYAEWTRR